VQQSGRPVKDPAEDGAEDEKVEYPQPGGCSRIKTPHQEIGIAEGKKGSQDEADREETQNHLQDQEFCRIGHSKKANQGSVKKPVPQEEDRLNDADKKHEAHKRLKIIMDKKQVRTQSAVKIQPDSDKNTVFAPFTGRAISG
jgi:hypothetical protein